MELVSGHARVSAPALKHAWQRRFGLLTYSWAW
jgi:hypothetical protein